MPGLYVHIPFCRRKCSYCDFYSLAGRQKSLDSYIDAILSEAETYPGLLFDTLYIGGGTPSLMGGKLLKKLLDGLKNRFDLSGLIEASIEANPESAAREFLEAAKESGINRVSFGVQSLNDDELKSVGRIHSTGQAIEAIRLAKSVGFPAISADLIIGLPGQTRKSLLQSIDRLAGLEIQHLSAYCLSLEEGTPLSDNPPDNLASDDEQAELFEEAAARLVELGFVHYEISNFARPGYACRHNLNYWRGGEYLGLGAAAASHLRGKRSRNKSDLDAYLKNPAGQVEYVEELDGNKKATEEAVLRLRLLEEGLNPDAMVRKFGEAAFQPVKRKLEALAGEGLLVYEKSRYRLPPSLILTSNQVFTGIIGD